MARLGDQVDVYCGKCKVERYHTVAAIGEGGKIERIVCGYCQSPRKYRVASPAAARPRARQSTGARRTPPIDMSTPGRPFSTAQTYDPGDVIQHSKYGRGRVIAVRGDRIDVKFIDGVERTFLHTPPPGEL
jgi:hypothetical protein